MKEKKPFHNMWKKAKKLTDEGNVKAVEIWEKMLIHLSKLSLKGENVIEGISIDLFKIRAWEGIEKLVGLPEYKEIDEEEIEHIFEEA